MRKKKARCEDMNEPFEREPWPSIKIIGDGTTAQVYINGQKVQRLLAYKVEQNAQEKRIAEVTLRVQCNLDLDITTIPALPEPWATAIKDKDGKINFDKVKAICP